LSAAVIIGTIVWVGRMTGFRGGSIGDRSVTQKGTGVTGGEEGEGGGRGARRILANHDRASPPLPSNSTKFTIETSHRLHATLTELSSDK